MFNSDKNIFIHKTSLWAVPLNSCLIKNVKNILSFFLTGTVYLQQDQPFLIMSGFCVYSVASALFMFPALFSYYQQALEIHSFEHADGAGRAYDLVIQPFIRFITMAIIPVISCALVLYVLVSVVLMYVRLGSYRGIICSCSLTLWTPWVYIFLNKQNFMFEVLAPTIIIIITYLVSFMCPW